MIKIRRRIDRWYPSVGLMLSGETWAPFLHVVLRLSRPPPRPASWPNCCRQVDRKEENRLANCCTFLDPHNTMLSDEIHSKSIFFLFFFFDITVLWNVSGSPNCRWSAALSWTEVSGQSRAAIERWNRTWKWRWNDRWVAPNAPFRCPSDRPCQNTNQKSLLIPQFISQTTTGAIIIF